VVELAEGKRDPDCLPSRAFRQPLVDVIQSHVHPPSEADLIGFNIFGWGGKPAPKPYPLRMIASRAHGERPGNITLIHIRHPGRGGRSRMPMPKVIGAADFAAPEKR
jgi:hypothetical protein